MQTYDCLFNFTTEDAKLIARFFDGWASLVRFAGGLLRSVLLPFMVNLLNLRSDNFVFLKDLLLQLRGLLSHDRGLLGELLHERLPVTGNLIHAEPVCRLVIPLLDKELLTSLAALELSLPCFNNAIHFLNLSHEDRHIIVYVDIKAFKLATGRLELLLEGLHLACKRRTELVQDIVVDLVILVAHFLLDGTVADLESTKEDEILSSLKGATTLSDLIKELVP